MWNKTWAPGRQAQLIAVLSVAMLAGGCAGSESATDAQEPLPQAEPGTIEVEVARDQSYMEPDDRFGDTAGLVDVYAPESGGLWPVVVVFHGDPSSVSKSWSHNVLVAADLADRGRVVFVPNWGHTSYQFVSEAGRGAAGHADVGQVRCAVAYAKEHAADYGGDPDHITVYGFSAGANNAMMAGLADADLIESCLAGGPAVMPQALVVADADMLLLYPGWDDDLAADPEAFYSQTPWRHTDGSHQFSVHLLVTDGFDSVTFARDVAGDPSQSFLTTRHHDIDLVAELNAMGILDDDRCTAFEGYEWALESLRASGYDPTWTVLPDSVHEHLSNQAHDLIVQTIIDAENTLPHST